MSIRGIVACSALFAALAMPVSAQNARTMHNQVEASLLVTGMVDIDRRGLVTGHAVDGAEQLPPYVLDVVERVISAFRFEPYRADGEPADARARMGLRVVATQAADGGMNITVRGAQFGEDIAPDDRRFVRPLRMPPPPYPTSIAAVGGKGTVYLLLKVARDGSVEDIAAEQINLTAVADARTVRRIRQGLEQAAVRAARGWRFAPPSEGVDADKPHWVVRVPVAFVLEGDELMDPRQWSAYLPGPRYRPDWANPPTVSFAPDAFAAGGVYQEQSMFRLLTPLGE